MAAGTALQVTSGTGPYLALGATYTESGKTVADQKIILGEPYLPTYIGSFGSLTLAATSAHQWELHAGASLNVRIRRIRIWQTATGTAGNIELQLFRLTTAGTGTSIGSISPLGPTDPTAGATGLYSLTVASTEGNGLHIFDVPQGSAYPLTGCFVDLDLRDYALVIPAGTANGVAVKVLSNPGGSPKVAGFVEFTETPF